MDGDLIPTGVLADVGGTRFDFRAPKRLFEAGKRRKFQGFDHNFVLNRPGSLRFAARVEGVSGRYLEVYSDQPGLQFYTGNMLKGLVGKEGAVYHEHAGLCLESQIFPDAVNVPEFNLDPILRPGQVYQHQIIYKVGIN